MALVKKDNGLYPQARAKEMRRCAHQWEEWQPYNPKFNFTGSWRQCCLCGVMEERDRPAPKPGADDAS